MKKFVDFIYKNNKKMIAVIMIINILAIIGIFNLKIDTSFDLFSVSGSKYIDNLEILEEEFPVSDQMLIMTEYDENNESTIIDFEHYLESFDSLDAIKGISTSSDMQLPIEIEAYSSIIESDDGQYALITVFPNDEFRFKDVKNIEQYLKDEDIQYYISGDKYMQNKIFDYLIYILCAVPPLVIFLLFNIFRIQMRSFKAAVLSVLPAILGGLWTLGFAGLFGHSVSVLSVLAPIFALIIGSADGLHFISHVQDHLEDGNSMRESITKALRMVGVPMIITTLTSVAGFIALMLINTEAIALLAIFASIGIALAGIATWVVLPVINSMEKIDIRKKAQKLTFNLGFNKFWGAKSFVIAAVLLVSSVFFIPNIQNEFNQTMVYRNFTSVSKSFDKIMEVNKGTIPVFALIEYDENPFSDEAINSYKEFESNLIASGSAENIYSIYTIWDLLEDEMPPNTDMSSLNLDKSELYKEMVGSNYVKVIVFPIDLNNATIEKIESSAEGVDNIILAGGQFMMYELNQIMVKGFSNSLIAAFALVFLSLLIFLRRFSISVIAMLPIAITTTFLFGFLGATGISLNLFTATIFSITIGIGIDYAVHFTSVYQSYKRQGLSSLDAVNEAYKYTSRPIIANALGFSLGLSSLFISPLKVHLFIASLMWMSMIVSSFLSLSFLPTILKKLK